MSERLLVDFVSHDPSADEYVFYLVENWSLQNTEQASDREAQRITNRIFNSIDTIIDGRVAKIYGQTNGASFRVQIDSPHGESDVIRTIVERINAFVTTGPNDYTDALSSSPYVESLRVVTGHQMGRFKSARE